MARMMGGEEEGGRKALGFMYEGGKVPGLQREERKDYDEDDVIGATAGGTAAGSDSLYERQPGDDDAAAAFRAMLARGTVEDSKPTTEASAMEDAAPTDEQQEEKMEHVDNRTNLEKAVGRGINSGSGVTLNQQMERFPMLKNAPMVLQKPKDGEAEQSTDVAGLNFKPLGQVLRNVKCLSCGKWGHSRGDRECEVSGWDPFSMKAPVAPAAARPASEPNVDVKAPADTFKPSEEHRLDKRKSSKREKKRHKEDRHKRKRKHKQRRRRSPSYSSDSSSSYDSRDRHRKRDRKSDDESDDRGHKKESRYRSSSSRKHKRRRERSRSPSYSDDSRRQRHDGDRR